MAERELIVKEKVEIGGIYDFGAAYGYAYSWLKNNNYGVNEDKYSEKISGNTKEVDVEWRCSKKISDYFKYEIFVRWEIKNMTDVEVEIDGKKKKMNKGKLTIELKATLVRDYLSKWEGSATLKFFRDIYNKYVIPQRANNMEDQLSDEVRAFKEEMKAFLELSAKR